MQQQPPHAPLKNSSMCSQLPVPSPAAQTRSCVSAQRLPAPGAPSCVPERTPGTGRFGSRCPVRSAVRQRQAAPHRTAASGCMASARPIATARAPVNACLCLQSSRLYGHPSARQQPARHRNAEVAFLYRCCSAPAGLYGKRFLRKYKARARRRGSRAALLPALSAVSPVGTVCRSLGGTTHAHTNAEVGAVRSVQRR